MREFARAVNGGWIVLKKVSIVVPIYNVERYLAQCLDSLRGQTYGNIEIVCVNDGATDRSAAVLDMFAKADKRIKIVEKANGGLSSARNAGIMAATGDIVCFVDSDDSLLKHAICRIVEAFELNDADIVTFGGVTVPEYRCDPWLEKCLSPRDAVYTDFCPDLLTKESSHPFAWRTACKLDFLRKNNLLFNEELRFGEDQLFHYAIYPRSSKTVLISDRLYRYRVEREGSLMDSRSGNRYLKIYDHIRIVEAICREWQTAGLLDKFGIDLLLDNAEFVLHDVLSFPRGERVPLCNFLQAVWTTYFDDAQLLAFMNNRIYGKMASAVLCDRGKSYGLHRKLLYYGWTMRRDPMQFVRNGVSRFLHIGPIDHLRLRLRSVLPCTGRAMRHLLQEAQWESEDFRDFERAMIFIEMEVRHSSSGVKGN